MWSLRRAAVPALLAAGLVSACRRDDAPRPTPPVLRAEPAPPRELAAELFVPRPAELWSALRRAVGPKAELLPKAPELALGAALGLDPLVAASLELGSPVVGAVLLGEAGEVSFVLGVRVRSGAELVAALTTGNAPSHRALAVGGDVRLLVGRAESPTTARLAVLDDVLLAGSRADLASAGEYVARGLAARVPVGGPRLVASASALRGRVVPLLRRRFHATLAALAASEEREAEQRGRAADFADPRAVLAAADAVVSSALDVLDSTAELRLALDAGADFSRLVLTLRPATSGAARELALRLPSAPTARLGEVSGGAVLGLLLQRTPARDGGGAPDLGALFAGRSSAADARALEAALEAIERGRGATELVALLPEYALVWSGDVADARALERGLAASFKALERPPLRGPLEAFVGSPRVKSSSRAAADAEPVHRVILEFTRRVATREASVQRFEVLYRVLAERFLLVAAPEPLRLFERVSGGAAVAAGADAALAALRAALPSEAALALVLDVSRLGFGASDTGSAPIAASVARQHDSIALELLASHAAMKTLIEHSGVP